MSNDFPEVFGAPNGFSLALRNQQAEVNIQQDKVKLEDSTIALDQQKKLISAMQSTFDPKRGAMPDGKTSPGIQQLASQDAQMATLAFQTGNYEIADKFSMRASEAVKNDAYMQSIQLEKSKNDLDHVAGMLSTPTNEAEWHMAVLTAAGTTADGKIPPFLLDQNGQIKPYTPEFQKMIVSSVMTAKEKAEVAFKQSQITSENALTKERESATRLNDARAKEAGKQKVALNKVAGKNNDLVPKESDVKFITDLADEDFSFQSDSANRNIARQVVNDAKFLEQNQGMSHQDALRSAYEHASDPKGPHYRYAPGKRLRGVIGTEKTPAPMPTDKTGRPDMSQLRAGMYIQGTGKYAGHTLYFDGKGFSLTSVDRPALGGNNDAGDLVENQDEVDRNPKDYEEAQ
jgi:hypothetical protein